MSVNNLPNKPDSPRDEGLVPGGGPPYDGSMESRVQRLESDIAVIKADLAVMRSNYATKADLAEVRAAMAQHASSLIKWVVGTAIGLGAAGITVMTFVLNNAIPKAPIAPAAAPAAAPIVITVPYPQSPVPPQPPQK